MQPLMRCNICKKIFEPMDTLEYRRITGHNLWEMIRRGNMTKREEVRKGIEEYTEWPAALWAYLHSQGLRLSNGEPLIVSKVEKE